MSGAFGVVSAAGAAGRRYPRRAVAKDRNPQAHQMADESMVRNLAAQAEAIWPQERELFLRHGLPPAPRILDVACGTGEISLRLAELFPDSDVTGVDLEEAHLARARARADARPELGGRVRFARGDAFALDLADESFDLVVCRHFLQAVPDVEVVLAELVRTARRGGRVHVLAEDYGMMFFAPTSVDTDAFWRDGPIAFARATGTDLRSGRRIPHLFAGLGLADVRVDYVAVDTLRVPRATFAAIWEAWRDGYAAAIGSRTGVSEAAAREAFDAMIACIRDPQGYGAWLLPAISGTRS